MKSSIVAWSLFISSLASAANFTGNLTVLCETETGGSLSVVKAVTIEDGVLKGYVQVTSDSGAKLLKEVLSVPANSCVVEAHDSENEGMAVSN